MGTVAPREALSQPALRTVTAMAWQFIITWQRSVSKQIEMSSEPTVVPAVQGVVRGCGARVWCAGVAGGAGVARCGAGCGAGSAGGVAVGAAGGVAVGAGLRSGLRAGVRGGLAHL